MLAMAERDSQLAYSVLDHDDAIDQIEVYIDRQCIEIFALLQPAARDLRLVISVVKIAPLLERIADHACNIAQAKSLPELQRGELPQIERLLQRRSQKRYPGA